MNKSVDGMRKELLGLNLYALSNIEKPIALNALSLLSLVDTQAAEIKRLRDALENIAMFESEVPARKAKAALKEQDNE